MRLDFSFQQRFALDELKGQSAPNEDLYVINTLVINLTLCWAYSLFCQVAVIYKTFVFQKVTKCINLEKKHDTLERAVVCNK